MKANDSELGKYWTLLILVILIVLRLSIIKFPEELALQVMSAINAIAVDVVIMTILSKTLKMMEALHKEIGKEKRAYTPENTHIKKFRRGLTYVSFILITITIAYVIFKGNSVVNDILTIIALIFSLQDDVIEKFLVSKYYQYF